MPRRGTILLTVCACLVTLSSSASGAVPPATLLPNGQAVGTASAPTAVKAMIEAANRIRHRPYVWGGGHREWSSRGRRHRRPALGHLDDRRRRSQRPRLGGIHGVAPGRSP